MTKHMNNYIGRLVRLDKNTFGKIAQRARARGITLENAFLVAQVSRQMRKLICYGACFKIAVNPANVVLI